MPTRRRTVRRRNPHATLLREVKEALEGAISDFTVKGVTVEDGPELVIDARYDGDLMEARDPEERLAAAIGWPLGIPPANVDVEFYGYADKVKVRIGHWHKSEREMRHATRYR